MFLKSTVGVTTERIMKVVKMGLMSGEGFTEKRKLQLGMSYARSIRDQINRQHHKYFLRLKLLKSLIYFPNKSQCAYIYFTIIYSIFQTNDYNISNPSIQWNITSVDMSTLRTLNTYCKIEIEFLIILKVRHRGSWLPTELQAVYSSSQSEVFEDVPYPTSRGVFGLHTPPPPWKCL